MAYTTQAIYRIDLGGTGNDAARADLAPSAYANNGAGLVRVTVASHTLVTGAVADIAGTTSSVYNGAWKITYVSATQFDLQESTYSVNPAAKGTCIPRGGHAWGADAWASLAGATLSRHQSGDLVIYGKSPIPTSLGLSGTWTNGPIPAALSSPTTDTSTPIVMTKTGHGLIAGDVVQVVGHSANVGATGANGVWIVGTVAGDTFQLIGSTPLAGNGSGGTVQKVTSKAVTLAGAEAKLCLTVDKCEVAWSGANGVTPARTGIATDCKAGDACMQIAAPASPATGTLYGYSATGTIDLSACSKLTFWIKNEVAVLVTHWTLCLCNNADGTDVVGTCTIPAIPSTGQWVPLNLTITVTGGRDLTTVKSVALISGSVAPTASKYIRLDNILATTTAGLNLQALISANTAEQGGHDTNPWLCIQGIYPFPTQTKTVVLLDQDPSVTKASAGRGWMGTNTVGTAYIRETSKPPMVATSGTVSQLEARGGSGALPITIRGGYNTSDVRDGETILDGQNGFPYGFQTNGNYVRFEYLGAVRCFRAFAAGSNTGSMTVYGCWANNTGSNAFLPGASAYNNLIQLCTSWLSAATPFSLTNTLMVDCRAIGSLTYSASFSNSTAIRFYEANSLSGGVLWVAGNPILIAPTLLSTIPIVALQATYNQRIYLQDYPSAGSHAQYVDGGTITTAATTLSGGTGNMWVLTPASTRDSGYPLDLLVGKFALAANETRVVTLNMQLGHAMNVVGQLVCPGGQIAGIAADVVTNKTADTNWQQLSISLPPTAAGVVEIYARAYYVGGASYVNVDSLGIS